MEGVDVEDVLVPFPTTFVQLKLEGMVAVEDRVKSAHFERRRGTGGGGGISEQRKERKINHQNHTPPKTPPPLT